MKTNEEKRETILRHLAEIDYLVSVAKRLNPVLEGLIDTLELIQAHCKIALEECNRD